MLLHPTALSGPRDRTKWCIIYYRPLDDSLRDDAYGTSTYKAWLIEDSLLEQKSLRH